MALRVGIIGTGAISRNHVDGYRHAGAEVVALCDPNPTALAAASAQFGVESTTTSPDELYARGDVDAVSICTPNAYHHPLTLAAAAAGKHVLCEKPISLDPAQGREMVEACAAAGVVLQVGHHLRSSASAERVKAMIDAGELGRITAVRFRQAHDWGGSGVRGVFGSRAASGGGTLLDNGCHMFDLARFFCGDVSDVFARVRTLQYDIEVEDTAHVSLGFASGAIGTLEAGWTATGYQEGFCVYGTAGSIECDSRAGGWNVLVHRHRSSGGTSWGETDVTRHELFAVPAHSRQIEHFISTIEVRRPVVCSGQDGIESVRLVLAAYRSAEIGQPVALG